MEKDKKTETGVPCSTVKVCFSLEVGRSMFNVRRSFNTKIAMFLYVIISLFVGGPLLAIETASYQVVEKDGDFEIRQYAPYIVAETLVEGEMDEVGNEGFRRLFGYISGNNQKKQSISMTAPVTQEKTAEKIAMTAPVTQERAGGKFRITFMLPSEYTLETLPEPLDSRVALAAEPARLVAAIQYSGTWSLKRFEEHKKKLDDWILKRGLKPLADPVWARYDPPFKPWFLRRNEVLIPVERQ
jgi:hypothetical protein